MSRTKDILHDLERFRTVTSEERVEQSEVEAKRDESRAQLLAFAPAEKREELENDGTDPL